MDTPWVDIALEALDELDEDVCFEALRDVGAPLADTILLVEGEVTGREALGYARALIGLGRSAEARDVLSAALEAQDASLRYAAAK